MKYTIHGEHQKYFRAHHYIEFENLLSDEQVEELQKSISSAFCLRLGITIENLAKRSFEDLFAAGHDLFRQDFTVRKYTTKRNFAEIAFELSDERPLRLAYDQVFYSGVRPQLNSSKFFSRKLNLRQISGLQGSLIGLVLCLNPGIHTENSLNEPPFAAKKGSGIFLSEDLTFSLDLFYSNPNACYLLVVFTGSKALVLQDQFFPFAYKQVGYSVGDLLKDDLHPILLR